MFNGLKNLAANLRNVQQMSGSEPEPLEDIIQLFERRGQVDGLSALIDALAPDEGATDLSSTAIAIDSNVFMRLSTHSKSALIIDYLASQHSAPLVLPGQAVQEFWNNQIDAVDTVASKLKKSFEAFSEQVGKIPEELSDFTNRMNALLGEFSEKHGYLYEGATVTKTSDFLSILKEKAVVPYCPRPMIHDMAAHRKSTKTPPGFKDHGDGDFFIWADLLYGLRKLQLEGRAFSTVVLVTNDTKKDWSREGKAHPILAAEIAALLDARFETWTLDKLIKEIESAVD